MHPMFAGALAAALIACAPAATRAQTGAEFFAGKTINVVSPFEGAGVYPALAREIAAALPKYLPGAPRAIVQFMPGAGGLRAANYLYRVAPRDGATIAVLYDGFATSELMFAGGATVDYKSAEFTQLGALNDGDHGVIAVRPGAAAHSIEEARRAEIIMAGTSPGTANVTIPTGLNLALGTRFKVVPGYSTMSGIIVALEQGEVDGVFANYANFKQIRPDWIRDGGIIFMAQTGATRSPELGDTPLLTELTDQQPARDLLKLLSLNAIVGKAFMAPPGVPPERVAILRQALAATMRDPDFLGIMAKLQIEVAPRAPEEISRIIDETLAMPGEVVALAREKLGAR